MRQPYERERAPASSALEFDSNSPAPERAPESNFHARRAPDACLLELALRLSGNLPLTQAVNEALSAVSALFPDCQAEIRDNPTRLKSSPSNAPPQPQESALAAASARHSSAQSLGCCEWSLTDDPEGPMLVVWWRRIHQPRELARVLDVGERVATLLGPVMSRERSRQRLIAQTQEVLDLRQRVIQAEKLASYGQLVASVVHDLNNPLTAILAYAEYLNRTMASAGMNSADLERLSRIRDAAEAVLRQTRGLVEYACPPRTPFARVDVATAVRRAVFLCEHELTRANVDVSVQLDPTLPGIDGHAEHLTQLFVNLLTNSAHAACANGARIIIDAVTQDDGHWLIVKVHDNGQGIQARDLEHVFDPFYTTKMGTGCGLGLSIVRDIAEHHGGRIGVESTPSLGTTFTLHLPVARLPEALASTEAASS